MKDIIISAGETTIKAKLNDTVAAKDFETRLPFEVDGHDSGIDYCCVAQPGKFDPSQFRDGWENGDINLAGGWFALLYDGQEESEQYKDMMIIGHIEGKELEKVRQLPENVHFVVDFA